MNLNQPQLAQTEAAVLMRHRAYDNQRAAVARETIFAPADSSEFGDRSLAELIGTRISSTSGYSLVFMRRCIARGPRRDLFIAAVERASSLEAGVGFGLVFPTDV